MKNLNNLLSVLAVTIVATIIGGVSVFYITSDKFNTVDARVQFITIESPEYAISFKANKIKEFMVEKGFPVFKPETGSYNSNFSIIAVHFKNNTDKKISSIEIISPNLIFAYDSANPDKLLDVVANGLIKVGELSIDQERKIILGAGYNDYSNWFEQLKIVADNKRTYPRLDSIFGFFSTNLGMIFLTLGVIGLIPLAIMILLIPVAILFHFKPDWQYKGMSEKEKDKTLLFAKKIIVERREKNIEASDEDSQEIMDIS